MNDDNYDDNYDDEDLDLDRDDDINTEEDQYNYDLPLQPELRPEANAFDRVARRWEESSDEERFERAMYKVTNSYKIAFDQVACRDMLSAVARDMPIKHKNLETLILGYYTVDKHGINKERFNSVLSRLKTNKINYIKPEDLLKYGRFVQIYYANYAK